MYTPSQKDDTEKKKTQLNNELMDIFYNNREIKDLSVEINLKERAQVSQQNGRPIPIHIKEQVAKDIKRLIENGFLKEQPNSQKIVL